MKKAKPTKGHQLYMDSIDNYISSLEMDMQQIQGVIHQNKSQIVLMNKKNKIEQQAITLRKKTITETKRDMAQWKEQRNY